MTILKTLYEKDLYPEIEDAGSSEFARDCVEIAATRYARGEFDRRAFLTALGAIGMVSAAGFGSKAHAAEGEIVVVNWGGPAVEAYQNAWGQPFEQDTGIKVVIDGTGPASSKIRAMVEAGAVVWDCCDTGLGTTLVLDKAGLLQPIDYSVVDKSKVVDGYAYDAGVANYLFSYILAYNKAKLAEAPQNWADFWNLDKYPGMRTMRKQPDGQLEAAMMAAGRSIDEVYPIDIELAMSKFREISDNVIVWGSGSQSQELFRTGEVDLGNIWHTRANLLHDDMNGDVTWTWNQGIATAGMWNVPKNNPAGLDKVMQFIASTQIPERQVILFMAMGNGPANPAGAPLVPDDMRWKNPSEPENWAKQAKMNGQWYEEDSGRGNLTNDALARELYLDVFAG